MYKFGKKMAALLLTAVVAVSTVTSAFAVNSPVSGNSDSSTTVTGATTSDNTITVTGVTSTSKTATIPATVTSGNKTYTVDNIATGTIAAKYSKVYLILNDTTTVSAKIAKSKKAKKTKKLVISAASGKKLTAAQFNKKAFKGFKGKITVKKSAMSKKQFKKLVKRLRKGGFKGKIVYKG